MRKYRENVQSTCVVSSQDWRSSHALLALLLLIFWPTASAMPQSVSAPPAKAQTPSQSGSQPATTAQTDSGDKQQSLGDAARKANAEKDKPKSKHVFTDDDISAVGGTISVVGNESSANNSSARGNSSTDPKENDTTSSPAKNEAAIKDQITAVDQEIRQKKDEIAKAGPTSFDPSTGLSQNVIIVELKDLERRKHNLERQLYNSLTKAAKPTPIQAGSADAP